MRFRLPAMLWGRKDKEVHAHMFDQLPNFMILGVAKAGTTSLHAYLQQHPEIFMSSVKEPHFFDQRVPHYLRKLDVYLRECFPGADAFPLRGEATPTYFTLPEIVAPRLREFYGDRPLKFVVGLRDPVTRAWSHYTHCRGTGEETESFARALELEAERLARPKPGWVGYYRDGLYARHLKQWLEHFDIERFEFFLSDDLRNSGDATLRRILSFLGADPTVAIDTSELLNPASHVRSRFVQVVTGNQSRLARLLARVFFGGHYGMSKFRLWLRNRYRERYAVPPQMDSAIEADLRRRYAEDVVEMSRLIGRDLSRWLPPSGSSSFPSPPNLPKTVETAQVSQLGIRP